MLNRCILPKLLVVNVGKGQGALVLVFHTELFRLLSETWAWLSFT